MVTNVGAVGALSCRVSGAEIQATQQSYALSGCQLDPGERRNMERSWADHGDVMGISWEYDGIIWDNIWDHKMMGISQ